MPKLWKLAAPLLWSLFNHRPSRFWWHTILAPARPVIKKIELALCAIVVHNSAAAALGAAAARQRQEKLRRWWTSNNLATDAASVAAAATAAAVCLKLQSTMGQKKLWIRYQFAKVQTIAENNSSALHVLSSSFRLLGVESCEFMLRKKELLAKLSKFTKWWLFPFEMVLGFE